MRDFSQPGQGGFPSLPKGGRSVGRYCLSLRLKRGGFPPLPSWVRGSDRLSFLPYLFSPLSPKGRGNRSCSIFHRPVRAGFLLSPKGGSVGRYCLSLRLKRGGFPPLPSGGGFPPLPSGERAGVRGPPACALIPSPLLQQTVYPAASASYSQSRARPSPPDSLRVRKCTPPRRHNARGR